MRKISNMGAAWGRDVLCSFRPYLDKISVLIWDGFQTMITIGDGTRLISQSSLVMFC